MSAISSSEHAHQLALRIQQLRALRELWNELHSARAMPHHIFGDSPTAPLSETVMLMLLLSMLYSVFDAQPTAVNLARLTPESTDFSEEIALVLQRWRLIEGPITRIRHTFAFHGDPECGECPDRTWRPRLSACIGAD